MNTTGRKTMKRNLTTYLRLFDIADRLIKHLNPCANCQGCGLFDKTPYNCCKGCPFLSETGCTTKSIACKLWLCDRRRTTKRGRHQLERLERIAYVLNVHYARATPQEVLAVKTKEHVWYLYYKLNRGAYSRA